MPAAGRTPRVRKPSAVHHTGRLVQNGEWRRTSLLYNLQNGKRYLSQNTDHCRKEDICRWFHPMRETVCSASHSEVAIEWICRALHLVESYIA
ncbi:hypothetical protein GDO78_023049 [Eleutherodactylus coqui]|uniref:Uncharacterized protein n=1 Tax=Eleutherodactylus coqui TaxID=57060 RepID=A0A8J6C4H2_ELECQ|nr:hypothetical protein GDO78_023049 [Eleutherodactylus coqui]